MSIWNMIYGHKFSYNSRVAVGFAANAVVMVVLPVLTNALEPNPAWAADIILLLIFGFFGGIV
jgi:hypothetical protein